MRTLLVLIGLTITTSLYSQYECRSFPYQQQFLANDPAAIAARESIENFIAQHLSSNPTARVQETVIKIPVVVHILYHFPSEDIADAIVRNQVAALNRDFRKLNADTTRIPSHFRELAADFGIEFELARTDPKDR